MKVQHFKNIKKLPLELSRLFSQDEKIQRLLVWDAKDALTANFTPLTFQELMEEKYINISPLNETGIKSLDRNTFMVINVGTSSSLENRDGNDFFEGHIYICSDLDHLVLKDYNLRLVELMSEIVDLINGEKFSCSGALSVIGSDSISYSTYLFGYDIKFTISDQPSKGAEL